MNKQILKNDEEIMQRHTDLEKIALSYWTPFAFTSSYCIVYPLLMKYKYSIAFSALIAYFLTEKLSKYYAKLFNNKEYNRYKTFCLKYKLYSNLII
jgi:hypothetical protein